MFPKVHGAPPPFLILSSPSPQPVVTVVTKDCEALLKQEVVGPQGVGSGVTCGVLVPWEPVWTGHPRSRRGTRRAGWGISRVRQGQPPGTRVHGPPCPPREESVRLLCGAPCRTQHPPPPPPAAAVPARHTRGLLPVSFACPVFSGTVLGTWWEFREGSVDEEGKSVLKHESASSGNTHAHPSVSQDKEEVLRGGRPSAGTARPSPRHTGPLAGGACWKTARPPSSRSWWWPCPLP